MEAIQPVTEIREEDISQFLSDVIELGGIHQVDKSPDKLIRLHDGTLETITVDGAQKNLAIYGTRSQDALIINPFSEGEANSARNSWFYLSRNVILSGIVIKLMKHLIEIGANSHKKNNKDTPDPIAIKLLESDITAMDEKMIKEFDQISKKRANFFVIHYNTSSHKGEVKSVIFNQAQRKAYPGIRVKTWAVFENLLGKLLEVRKLEDFDYTPALMGAPMLESFVHILINVYKRLIPALSLLSGFDDKLKNTGTLVGEIESHLKYLGDYYTKAKHVHSIANATAPVSAGPVAWNAGASAPVSAINTSLATPVGTIVNPVLNMPAPIMNPGMPVQTPQGGLTSFLAPTPVYNYQQPVMQSGPQPAASFFDNTGYAGGLAPFGGTMSTFDPSQVNADNPFARP